MGLLAGRLVGGLGGGFRRVAAGCVSRECVGTWPAAAPPALFLHCNGWSMARSTDGWVGCQSPLNNTQLCCAPMVLAGWLVTGDGQVAVYLSHLPTLVVLPASGKPQIWHGLMMASLATPHWWGDA